MGCDIGDRQVVLTVVGRDLLGGRGQGRAGGWRGTAVASARPQGLGWQVQDDAAGAVDELGVDVDQLAAQGGGADPLRWILSIELSINLGSLDALGASAAKPVQESPR